MPRFLTNRRAGRERIRADGNLAWRRRDLSAMDQREEAWAFFDTFTRATGMAAAAKTARWAEIRKALSARRHYEHTVEELTFGAQLAWRNHARCIGRLFWNSLEVRDRRMLSTPEAIFADQCDHLAEATGDGRIRSIISIYPPVRPGHRPCYFESAQFNQYAGYITGDGTILGDRRSVEPTRVAQSMGWNAPEPPGRFDLLPVVLRDGAGRRHMFEVPQGLQREVPIRVAGAEAFNAMGLRWYAVPIVSDMILTIGGIDYPCAPFNGFYMCTEIASRNFADRNRFDLLPQVASALGLGPDDHDPMWRDRTLTELNAAVMASFKSEGVTIVDHHAASAQFMEFVARETAAGRQVSGDWGWIVPPQASAGCEVFHLDMTDLRAVPNFYRSRALDAAGLMPHYGNVYRSRLRQRMDRMRQWARRRRERV
ncbi:MAG: nitric oxide synthase oxygenase [Pseudomonadota bacterium]